MPGPVVVCEPRDAALLARLLAGIRTGAPVVVLDPTWPAPLRASVVTDVEVAVSEGRVGTGDLVLPTSGSAGRPRAVVRSAASWDASLGPLSQVTGITGGDVVWLPGPLTSTLSLYGAWHATALGARVLLRDDDPAAATVVHTVPSVLAALAADATRVPSLRTVVVAGDRLPPPSRAAAQEHGWNVLEYYGAAELSFVAHRRDDGAFTSFPAVAVEVRDGVIWVRSPYLSRGYVAADGPWRLASGWALSGRAARASLLSCACVCAPTIRKAGSCASAITI